MREATLCFLIKENEILLGLKKKGFGKGKLNGFGGKVENNESIEEATIRELYEEVNVKIKLNEIRKMAELNFTFPLKNEWNQRVHVFIADKWEGNPSESDEMKPYWINFENLPFEKMWKDDLHWMPFVLNNKKIKANFTFKADNENIKEFNIEELNN